MQSVPSSELARLQALDSFSVLDSAPEQEFEDLATLAATICGVPISLVSFVAADRQWFKAEKGLGVRETSREVSFCAHTLEDKRTLVVSDTHMDPRFSDNPLVTGEPGIRFYAGAPIVTAEGQALGTVCVIDREPRVLTPQQIAALEALARQGSILLKQRLSLSRNVAMAAQVEVAFAQTRETNERLQVALDGAELASWFYDPTKNVVGGDARMARLFGLTIAEGPAELWIQAIVEQDRERTREEFAASLKGAPYDTRYRVQVNGQVRWVHARAKVSRAPDGSVRMTGICEDVSREEALARDLARTAERLEIAQNTSGASTFDWDLRSGKVKWIGNSFGRPPAEMLEASQAFALVYEPDREALERVIAHAIETGDEYHHECRGYWPDGSLRWVDTAGKPLRDETGEIASVVGVNVDITDRKLTEEVLLRTEKLAAVGRLASTISHEINNPLEAVTNLLYITRHSPSLAQADRDHLDLVDRELARVSNIVAQTLRFHRNPTSPAPVAAANILNEVLELYGSRLEASKISIKLEIAPDVVFSAFAGDIRQVLNNLVGNALDVMRQGGRLRIRARWATNWADRQRGAVMTIADTGAGIHPEAQSRVFEAFFSTKGIHGTGLGLWISKRIVHKHGGHLRFRSSTGAMSGTVFRLWLPLVAAASANEPLV